MNLPNRKPTRLKKYDYSSSGSYFVTICTKDRKELLSQIIVGDGVLDVPKNILTHFGEIADMHLSSMSDFYINIKIDKYVIMPNHIHLLIQVFENKLANGTSKTSSPTNSLIS